MGSEERKAKRVSTAVLFDVYEESSIVSKGRGSMIDISVTGVSFETTTELAKGTSIILRCDSPVKLKGEVMWSRKKTNTIRYGIKFKGLNFIDKLKLTKYIESISRNSLRGSRFEIKSDIFDKLIEENKELVKVSSKKDLIKEESEMTKEWREQRLRDY